MQNQTSSLKLIWRTHTGGDGKTIFHYLDFVVDGHSLYDALHLGDHVGCLGWSGCSNPDYEEEMAEVLLLHKPSSLITGRAILYVCAECGDIGCGSYTVRVEKTPEYFIWREFGYENDYDSETLDLATYSTMGPYYFNVADYPKVLKSRPGYQRNDHKI